MFFRTMEAVVGAGLLFHGILQIGVRPSWYAYVPVYLIPALLAVLQFPRNSAWRTLSSLSIVAGGLYTTFLLWTFFSINQTPTLELVEAKNLLPVALGTLLISFIRLTQDKTSQPIHYIRFFLILTVAVVSFYAITTSFQYLA